VIASTRALPSIGSEGLAIRTAGGLKAAIPATTAAGVALYPSAGLPATPQQPPAPPLSPEMANWWQNLQNQRFADPTAQ
jgi:hypothetical protein